MENSAAIEIMNGVFMAEDEHQKRGVLAQWVRAHILDGNFQVVGGAYGFLQNKHGKRSSLGKGQGYSASTPADSMRACIDNVSKALIGKEGYHAEGALKPIYIASAETWGLADKGAKKVKSVSVEKVAAKFASAFKTEEHKKAALIAAARAMGVGIKF